MRGRAVGFGSLCLLAMSIPIIASACAFDLAPLATDDLVDGESMDAPVAPDTSAVPPTDATLDSLPLGPCQDGQKTCVQRSLQVCVGTNWQENPCPELCEGTTTDTAKCVPWPSCRNTAGSTCGASKTGSCCEQKRVPGGPFKRRNQLDAIVTEFQLDVYEVTVGRFRAFFDNKGGTQKFPPEVGAGAHPRITNSGWQSEWNQYLPQDPSGLSGLLSGGTWTDAAADNETLPISNVPWLVAFAFCAWDSARLPTFAELNFAASGGNQQLPYPWSTNPTDTNISNEYATYNCQYAAPPSYCLYTCSGDGGTFPALADCTPGCIAPDTCTGGCGLGCDPVHDLAPVGLLAKGVGAYGHYDLSGNVAEYVLDAPLKRDNGALAPAPCVDCAPLMQTQPNAGTATATDDNDVMFAGGDYTGVATDLLTTAKPRDHWKWNERGSTVGIRCAR